MDRGRYGEVSRRAGMDIEVASRVNWKVLRWFGPPIFYFSASMREVYVLTHRENR